MLGGHVQACPEGHLERVWYNSCRHRMCPQGALIQVTRWLDKQKARLLAWEHDHVIFTRPHELKALWQANVAVMPQLLCASVHDTLLELLGDAKYLGARPGIIATLHTWSQTLLLHPHRHCWVTGGGLNASGPWVAVSNGFLLPMRVGMAVFRGKLRAALRQGLAQGMLQLPRGKSQQQVEHLLNKLGRQKWHVHIRERYPYGQGVLIYLARYLRGGPIAQPRLLSCDGQEVVFQYAERAKGPGGQATQRTMRLSLEQFIGRWLLPVPPTGAVRVRCWGLYADTQGAELARCRQQLGQAPCRGAPGSRLAARWRPRGGRAYGVLSGVRPAAGVCSGGASGWRTTASTAGLGAGGMRGRTAVEGRRGRVWPSDGRRGPMVSRIAPRMGRALPTVLSTTHAVGDVRLPSVRHQGGTGIQAP
jgi:hypothetical protein